MFTVANIGMRKWSRELTMAEILQIAQPQLSEYIGPGGRWTGCSGASALLLHDTDAAFKVDRAPFLFGWKSNCNTKGQNAVNKG